jgi:anti-sigma-K factor RskA
MIDPQTANLLRHYVDGELDAAAHAAFEARLRDDRELAAAIDVERHLRDRVASVMASATPPAPADLHDRVQTALAAASVDGARNSDVQPAAAEHDPQDEPVLASVGAGFPSSDDGGTAVADASKTDVPVATIEMTRARERFLREPSRVDWRAAAAVILLVTGAVLVGIFGTPLDQRGLEAPAQQTLVAETVEFIANEHRRCAMNEDARLAKAEWRELARAQHELARHLGVERVVLPDLSDKGYEFIGAGRCHLPGAPYSGHAIYRRNAPGQPPAVLSLFLMPEAGAHQLVDDELPHLQDGEWNAFHAADPDGSRGPDSCTSEGVKTVPFSSDGSVLYLLTCCDSGDLQKMCGACCETWRSTCSPSGPSAAGP